MSILETNISSVKHLCDHFSDSRYIYFITLKPPRDVNKAINIVQFCDDYLVKRKIRHWVVPSISPNDYVHYHGVIALDDDPKWDNHEVREKFKKAFQRKVNRTIGFSYPLQRAHSLPRIYKYINAQRITTLSDYVYPQRE